MGAGVPAASTATAVSVVLIIGTAAVFVVVVVLGVVHDAVRAAGPAVAAAAGDGGIPHHAVHIHDGRLPVVLRPGVVQQGLVDTGGGQGQDPVLVEGVHPEGPLRDGQRIVLVVVEQDGVQAGAPGEGVRPDDRGGIGELHGGQVDAVREPVGQVGDGDRLHVVEPDLGDLLPDLRPGLVVPAGEGGHAPGPANGQDTVSEGPGQRGLSDGPGGIRLDLSGHRSGLQARTAAGTGGRRFGLLPIIRAAGHGTGPGLAAVAHAGIVPRPAVSGEGADGQCHHQGQDQGECSSNVSHASPPHSTAMMVNTTAAAFTALTSRSVFTTAR